MAGLDVTLKDGVGGNVRVGAYQNADGNLTAGSVPVVSGLPVDVANPLPVMLPAGSPTAAAQSTANAALGTPADTAWAGTGAATLVAALKAVWSRLGGLLMTSAGGMTSIAVGTTSVQILPARTGRRRLSFYNTGAGKITLLYGAGPAVLGSGIILGTSGSAQDQGGAAEEPGHDCWAGSVYAIANIASTLTIVEG